MGVARVPEEASMANFVLVHGSWHAAWCWYKIAPRLRARGHRVDVPDLPGHGRDWRDPAEVTLDDHVARVDAAIRRCGAPVVLVAHSRSGIVASQTVERHPDAVQAVVYLAAYLLGDGETVLDLARHDRDSLVMPNLDVDPDGAWDMLRAEAFEPALYADCAAEDVALGHLLLTPEPLAPSRTPIRTTQERFGRVRRVYIELTQDRAVSPMLQRRMYTATPCDEVRSIAASHSAYFSVPDELAGHLDEIAARAAAT
jgi:pimeloyl-ACP methyl ester carboxylesterase